MGKPREHNTVPLERWPDLGATIQVTYIPRDPGDPPECDTALFTCRAKDTDLTLEQARALRDDLVALVAAMEGAPDPATLEGLEANVTATDEAHRTARAALTSAVGSATREAWPGVEWRHGTEFRIANREGFRCGGVNVGRRDGEWFCAMWRLGRSVRDDTHTLATADTLPAAMDALLALLDEKDADAVRAALGVAP